MSGVQAFKAQEQSNEQEERHHISQGLLLRSMREADPKLSMLEWLCAQLMVAGYHTS